MKKFVVILLLCLVMFSAFANGSGEKAATTETATATPSEKVFTFSRKEVPQSLDVWGQSNVCNYIIFNLIYDQLIYLDVANGVYTPGLATSWEISADGTQYTFKLREDVKFHNGQAMTADDVKCLYQRVIDDKTLTRASLFADLIAVDVLDTYTVKFTLKAANGYFMNLLAQFPGAIPSGMYAEKGADMFKADNVGTGPWVFKSWDVSTGSLEFTRNKDYWGECTSNCDVIKYVAIIEDATRVAAVRTGEIDMADSIPADYLAKLSAEGIAYDRSLAFDQLYCQFRNKGVFTDYNARMAFNYAIDRDAICAGIVQAGAPAAWPTVKNTIGYSDTQEFAYKQDMAKAKEYLSKSNYKGEEIRFIGPVGDYDHITEVLTAIQAWMTEAGFNVRLEQLQSAAFSSARKGGEYDIYITGSTWTQGDGYIFLNQRVLGDSFKSGFAIPEINNAILESNALVDYNARSEKLKEVYTLMYKNANMTFLYTLEAIVAYQPNISGVVFWGDKHTELRNVVKN